MVDGGAIYHTILNLFRDTCQNEFLSIELDSILGPTNGTGNGTECCKK